MSLGNRRGFKRACLGLELNKYSINSYPRLIVPIIDIFDVSTAEERYVSINNHIILSVLWAY